MKTASNLARLVALHSQRRITFQRHPAIASHHAPPLVRYLTSEPSSTTSTAAASMVEDFKSTAKKSSSESKTVEVKEACGDLKDADDDDEMEQEEMFVQAHDSFKYNNIMEWGGPRRGGRLPEPTRYGDWERKGRCTDF